MEKTLRMSLLFDFYGPLLTERQREVYEMYFHGFIPRRNR